jgi:hypothetical protein
MAAASILEARGFRNFTEIEGGFQEIKKTDLPFINSSNLNNPVCQI